MPPRSDAARNRTAILAAAQRLVERHGPSNVRIADVARAAGVGAGSVYRAVGSKSGLLLALLDEDERELQQHMIFGDPPLGPGAPPAQRLTAFVQALHRLVVRRRDVLIAADDTSALAHARSAVHAGWAAHVRLLIAELRPDADEVVLAELVLAAMSAPTYVHLIDDLGRDPDDVLSTVAGLVSELGRAPR